MTATFCIICDQICDQLDQIDDTSDMSSHYGETACGTVHPCHLTCTLGDDHDGPHEAAGSAGIYARWVR